ncbi:helix-turn-helix domain-containing protein [Streptomyces malaysiensis]|uniref:helix-turn-helix domain-containing protein n=1 Tax=Streptomyces malaysiensis TaxID=92644 RepID=UPI002B2F95E8|nr:helix-turn-helix transcriptional regulator [Streptomyces malaysiensis]
MPRRNHVTARQERLGAELRKLRERAGVTAREAADVVGMDQATMSHLEAGRVAAGEKRVRQLTSHYGVSDVLLVDALAAIAAERVRGWWGKYQGRLVPVLLDLAELEHHARGLKLFQMVHVPGLFQTEDYMRALHVNAPYELSPELLEATVDFRLSRQQVLDRDAPPETRAVVHEAALRIKVGDRKVARGQLDHLLEASTRPCVSLRVISFEEEGFAGAGLPMLYAEGPVRQLDTVQFDTVNGSVFSGEEKQLADYRRVFGMMESAALPVRESHDLIHRIAEEL